MNMLDTRLISSTKKLVQVMNRVNHPYNLIVEPETILNRSIEIYKSLNELPYVDVSENLSNMLSSDIEKLTMDIEKLYSINNEDDVSDIESVHNAKDKTINNIKRLVKVISLIITLLSYLDSNEEHNTSSNAYVQNNIIINVTQNQYNEIVSEYPDYKEELNIIMEKLGFTDIQNSESSVK